MHPQPRPALMAELVTEQRTPTVRRFAALFGEPLVAVEQRKDRP